MKMLLFRGKGWMSNYSIDDCDNFQYMKCVYEIAILQDNYNPTNA